MNDDGSDLEKSSEPIEMTKKLPTAAFVAGRLKEVGWGVSPREMSSSSSGFLILFPSGLMPSISGPRKPDVVIAVGSSALKLALTHRDELFEGVRIVFVNVGNREVKGREMPPNVTELWMALMFNVRRTLSH
jgi:hypothetical protein